MKIDKNSEISLSDLEKYAVVSQIAHMYYELKMNQPEIARKMYFSRSKVSRMLSLAEDLGIVEFKVKKIMNRSTNIEEKLKDIFNIEDAIVITSFDEDLSSSIDIVTDFAALYVSNLIKGSCTLGISRGRTTTKTVNKLKKVKNCELKTVQLMGTSAVSNINTDSRELVNSVIQTFAGIGYYLNIPIYVDDLYAKNVLLSEDNIEKTFKKMDECNIILTGLGTFDSKNPEKSNFGYFKPTLAKELLDNNAAGSICAKYYDVDGKLIDCEWNEKCIAIPFDSIRKAEKVIAVAVGPDKIRPILGALNGRLINILITNVETANQVIAQNKY